MTVFCNKRMVENIRDSVNGTMHLVTNAGSLATTQKADLPQCGDVWFNDKAITNIFSYVEMADRYRITYDSEKEDAFIATLVSSQLLSTVEENKSFYTP